MSKKLSIAIPTYNRLAYLKECINSILNQTFQDFSIFVFDNASDEPVEKELKNFNDEKIHFIGSDKNIGSAGNINRILSYSFDSKYLTIFHDDDLMYPKMLELQTSFLDNHGDVLFVVSELNMVCDKNISDFKNFNIDKIKYNIYKNNHEFTKAIMSWLRYAFDSTMYKTEAIGNSRMNFDKFSDFADRIFLTEISKKGSCAFINIPLVNYRIHHGQDSKLFKKSYEKGVIETLMFSRENLPSELDESETKLFRQYSLNFLIYAYAHINGGFFNFLKFMKGCYKQRLIKLSYFKYINVYGITSLASIFFKNKKIFDIARCFRDFFKKLNFLKL